jgi:hypothetical protein
LNALVAGADENRENKYVKVFHYGRCRGLTLKIALKSRHASAGWASVPAFNVLLGAFRRIMKEREG